METHELEQVAQAAFLKERSSWVFLYDPNSPLNVRDHTWNLDINIVGCRTLLWVPSLNDLIVTESRNLALHQRGRALVPIMPDIQRTLGVHFKRFLFL